MSFQSGFMSLINLSTKKRSFIFYMLLNFISMEYVILVWLYEPN